MGVTILVLVQVTCLTLSFSRANCQMPSKPKKSAGKHHLLSPTLLMSTAPGTLMGVTLTHCRPLFCVHRRVSSNPELHRTSATFP